MHGVVLRLSFPRRMREHASQFPSHSDLNHPGAADAITTGVGRVHRYEFRGAEVVPLGETCGEYRTRTARPHASSGIAWTRDRRWRMLSVVTLVRDRNAMLRNFLWGWDRQRGDTDLEVVVVHAGGDEDPREVCAEFDHLDTKVVELGVDGGDTIAYSTARNRGAAHAEGTHLAFADADTIPGPDVARLIHEALDHDDALLTGEIWYLPPGRVSGTDFAALRRRARIHPARPPAPSDRVDLSLRHEMVWGLSMAMRRASFECVGGFDEGYHGYAGEDTDLAVAFRDRGIPAGVVGGAQVLHQHHDSWEPPLHQFTATLANARRFRIKWGTWPMQGWLDQFEDMGLIQRSGGMLRILRTPTAEEVERHRMTAAAPFRGG